MEKSGAPGLDWHSDLVYTDTINHGGLLRAIKTTSRGGTTGFIDQIEAYARLPQHLKERIEDLSVVYQMGPLDSFPYAWKSKVRVVKLAEHARQALQRIHPDFPPVAHPLVFTQPETGRKVLNLSPLFARYIEGMQDAAGDALLADLAGHILDCPAYHTAGASATWCCGTTGECCIRSRWRPSTRLGSCSAPPLPAITR